MQEIHVKDKVFGAKMVLVMGGRDELGEFADERFPGSERIPLGAQGYMQSLVCRDDGVTTYLVQLVPSSSLSMTAANLSHECLHVAIASLKDAGVRWDDPELLCYYSQFFFGKAYKAVLEELLKEKKGEKECRTKE